MRGVAEQRQLRDAVPKREHGHRGNRLCEPLSEQAHVKTEQRAGVALEVSLDVPAPVTQGAVIATVLNETAWLRAQPSLLAQAHDTNRSASSDGHHSKRQAPKRIPVPQSWRQG